MLGRGAKRAPLCLNRTLLFVIMSDTAQQLQTLAGLLSMPEDDGLDIITELAEEEPWLQDALKELTYVSLDQWQGEYTRLFLSHHPTTVCPPYESAYRHGEMCGPAIEELDEIYRKAGLESQDIPSDFLGTILSCIAYLEDWDGPVAKELKDELWQKHLALWLPRFAEDLMTHSKLQLYRNLGKRLIQLYAAQTELPSADD